jgi:hypothetical protein
MARKIIPFLIFLLMLASIYAAHAIGVGGEGRQFGRIGATAGKAIPFVPPPSCGSPDAPDGVVDLSKCSNAFYAAVIF